MLKHLTLSIGLFLGAQAFAEDAPVAKIQCSEIEKGGDHKGTYDYAEFTLKANESKTFQSNVSEEVQYLVTFPGDGELGSLRSANDRTPPVASGSGAVVSVKEEDGTRHDQTQDGRDVPKERVSSQDETKTPAETSNPHPSEEQAQNVQKSIFHTDKKTLTLIAITPRGAFSRIIRMDNVPSAIGAVEYRAGRSNHKFGALDKIIPMSLHKTRFECQISR